MPCDDGVCFDTASGVRLGVNGANVCRPCGNTGRPQCQSALPLLLHVPRPPRRRFRALVRASVCSRATLLIGQMQAGPKEASWIAISECASEAKM